MTQHLVQRKVVILSFALAAWLSSFTASTAYADPATESRIHFQKGIQLIKAGKLEPALERFLVANRLAPNTNILFNIALCLDKLDKKAEAFVYYKELLDKHTLDKNDRQRVEKALKRITPLIARLKVITKPPGATIYVDRRNLGHLGCSPRTLALSPGERRIFLEKAGHEKATRTIHVKKGQLETLEVQLTPITGTLKVTSSPPGARVWIDDDTQTPQGVTPLEMRLTPGLHSVVLKKKNFWKTRLSFRMEAHKVKKLEIKLRPTPPPKATLSVLSNVVGATVEIDGQFGGLTPLVRNDLSPGAHQVRVFHRGYEPWKKQIQLSAKRSANVSVQLEHSPRRLKRGPWPWILLGVTGAGLVAGTVLASLAYHNHQKYNQNPTSPLLSRGQKLNLSADLTFGFTGLTAVATAVAFLLTWPEKKRPSTGTILYPPPPRPRNP